MPRPTSAQFVSGTAVTVLSVVAVLLLSGAHIGWVVAGVACVGLVLGVLVAATLASPERHRPVAPDDPPRAPATRPGPRTAGGNGGSLAGDQYS